MVGRGAAEEQYQTLFCCRLGCGGRRRAAGVLAAPFLPCGLVGWAEEGRHIPQHLLPVFDVGLSLSTTFGCVALHVGTLPTTSDPSIRCPPLPSRRLQLLIDYALAVVESTRRIMFPLQPPPPSQEQAAAAAREEEPPTQAARRSVEAAMSAARAGASPLEFEI